MFSFKLYFESFRFMFNTLEKYPQFKNKAFVQRAKLKIKEIKELPSKGWKESGWSLCSTIKDLWSLWTISQHSILDSSNYKRQKFSLTGFDKTKKYKEK